MTVEQAAFAKAEPGLWRVSIIDRAISGEKQGNYQFSFADDVKAEIQFNVLIITHGWSMVVMSLESLSEESAGIWAGLGALALDNSVMQRQPDRLPLFGESFWVFNRDQDDVVLQGLKCLEPPAWEPPPSDKDWVMSGPPAEDYVVPEGVQVWIWNGEAFKLIPAGEKLPAGSAAWFWRW